MDPALQCFNACLADNLTGVERRAKATWDTSGRGFAALLTNRSIPGALHLLSQKLLCSFIFGSERTFCFLLQQRVQAWDRSADMSYG